MARLYVVATFHTTIAARDSGRRLSHAYQPDVVASDDLRGACGYLWHRSPGLCYWHDDEFRIDVANAKITDNVSL